LTTPQYLFDNSSFNLTPNNQAYPVKFYPDALFWPDLESNSWPAEVRY